MKRALEFICAVLAIAAVLFVIMACSALYADRIYGDWTCAFARCIKVKP